MLGSLVTLKGTVESVEKANDLIQTIMVKDEAGNIARVFIDGYITTDRDVENCEPGAAISATGLSSYDDTWPDTEYFARIRIRSRDDIICGSAEVPVTGIRLSRNEAVLAAGDETVLDAVVLPLEATNRNVIWTVDDEKIASVDQNGKVTALKAGKTVITVTAEEGGYTASCALTVLFADVQDSEKYYYEPVYWALENDITTGTSDSEFLPESKVTRGQIVTFLYRAADEPEVDVSDLPFTDVKKGAYYEKAVAWALENNITTGTSPTTFAPNEKCTRAQIVTFLYRFADEPEVSGTTPFTDVKAGAYYEKPVLWAYTNDITTGTSATTFRPNSSCTRGQAVTFIYRVCAE